MGQKSKVVLSLISAVGFSKILSIILSIFLAVPSISRTFIRGEIGLCQLPFMCKLIICFTFSFHYTHVMYYTG